MTSKVRTTKQSNLLLRIQVLNRQRRFGISRDSVSQFCADVLRTLEKTGPELSVVFVGPDEMRTINCRYLEHDYATDVLSFSYGGLSMEGRPFLGEIIIAPEVAARQAARYRVSPERELRKLLVHGILHLLGYNHESDRGRMKHLQEKLLRRKALTNSPSLVGVKERR